MKPSVRHVRWLLPFLLAGCLGPFHKKQPAQDRTLAARVQPSQTIPLVAIELPPEDSVIAAYAIYNFREGDQPIRPPARRRRLPNENPEDVVSAPDSPPPNPAVSAIGQLSSGDSANLRQQTENAIADIERRLNSLKRTLSDPEEKTAGHIREFLKEARAALASGDVEGAHTLAAKAQVLLAELTR